MRIVVGLLLLGVMLAGCSEDASSSGEEADTSFDDVEVTVTKDTGAIRGLVLDETIVPVAGAKIVLAGKDIETTSDDAGRFTFSDLEPGTYFLEASKDLHTPAQTSTEVVAGVAQPEIVKMQLNRLYAGDPFVVTIPNDGFFTCTQAGGVVWGYSSSPCHSVCVWTYVAGCAATYDGCDENTVCLPQERDFHADVGTGWQSQVWEMQWESSAYGTSEGLGITVSTYKPDRLGSHWFAQFNSFESPLYGRLDCNPTADGVCTEAGSASGVEPTAVPADGMTDMSYFISVRGEIGPAFAIDQDFSIWLSQSYYGPLPDGWSFINGSPDPF